MNGDDRLNLPFVNDLSQLPQTFAETIAQIEKAALQRLAEEADRKKLYYHTETHIRNVQRRSHQIFDAIYPALTQEAAANSTPIDLERMRRLLDLCAVAHDMVQIFEHNPQCHMTRRRTPGASEIATIEELVAYIHQTNQQLEQQNSSHARLTETDIAIIREAIHATICAYDSQEQAIYQPLLYDPQQSPAIVTRILALADIGALGMDGIEVYNQEGSLLFLEENPDVISLLQDGTLYQLEETNPALAQNIRQRLLSRCRFQVNFAKSRLARIEPELQGFPEATIPVLRHEIFKYLAPETVRRVEAITPTDNGTDLGKLLQFFRFEQYLDLEIGELEV